MADQERLAILEMEYALVAARLQTIDSEIALIKKRVDHIEPVVARTETRVTEGFDSVDRKLNTIIELLGDQ